MYYSPLEVKKAITGLENILDVRIDDTLRREFEAGLHPDLLTYKKLRSSRTSCPVIVKVLIGASTFLRQPLKYYDIFRVGRCVVLVHVLYRALTRCIRSQVSGLDDRLNRLCTATDEDVFDSVAFELITAGEYSAHPAHLRVEFIPETPCRRTPDFTYRLGRVRSFVECKKLDRVQEHAVSIRLTVSSLLNQVLQGLHENGVSAIVEVDFKIPPRDVSGSDLTECVLTSLRNESPLIARGFTATAFRLPRFDRTDLTLYPSPKFWWDRFGYRVRGEWFGIVHRQVAQITDQFDEGVPSGGVCSWIDAIEWDAGVKWKITNPDVLAKYRRFSFNAAFNGIEQVCGKGLNSSVHLLLETDYCIEGRQAAFYDLFNRLGKKKPDQFGWLVLNEILYEMSPRGIFDLVENAHRIRGPRAFGLFPNVSAVFAPGVEFGIGEFGIGVPLPDIDGL